MRLDQFQNYNEAIAYVQKNVYGCAGRVHAEKYLREKLPKESYYQKKIMDFLKAKYPDGVCWKEAAGAYSQQGIPDITFIRNGRYFGFEVKRPYVGVLSKIQEQRIKQIRAAGGVAEVVCFPEEVQEIIEKEDLKCRSI